MNEIKETHRLGQRKRYSFKQNLNGQRCCGVCVCFNPSMILVSAAFSDLGKIDADKKGRIAVTIRNGYDIVFAIIAKRRNLRTTIIQLDFCKLLFVVRLIFQVLSTKSYLFVYFTFCCACLCAGIRVILCVFVVHATHFHFSLLRVLIQSAHKMLLLLRAPILFMRSFSHACNLCAASKKFVNWVRIPIFYKNATD